MPARRSPRWCGSSPLSRRTSSRGSSWVEHRLVGGRRLRHLVLLVSSFVAGREGTVVGGVRSLGTLLGPEGVAVATISGDPTVDEPPAPGAAPSRGWRVRGGVGQLWGASRFLRTAQWTRASLSSESL